MDENIAIDGSIIIFPTSDHHLIILIILQNPNEKNESWMTLKVICEANSPYGSARLLELVPHRFGNITRLTKLAGNSYSMYHSINTFMSYIYIYIYNMYIYICYLSIYIYMLNTYIHISNINPTWFNHLKPILHRFSSPVQLPPWGPCCQRPKTAPPKRSCCDASKRPVPKELISDILGYLHFWKKPYLIDWMTFLQSF